jgi:Zn finger protein HypA/HybF involved in hydrogenase expression
MHESSLTAGLLRQIDAIARAEGGSRVLGITLRLGALTNIAPGHLREHFALAAVGTLAEAADVAVIEDTDPADANAQAIVLESVTLATDELEA